MKSKQDFGDIINRQCISGSKPSYRYLYLIASIKCRTQTNCAWTAL